MLFHYLGFSPLNCSSSHAQFRTKLVLPHKANGKHDASPPSAFFYFSVIMLVLFGLLLLPERCYLAYYVAKLYWCVGRHVGLSARL